MMSDAAVQCSIIITYSVRCSIRGRLRCALRFRSMSDNDNVYPVNKPCACRSKFRAHLPQQNKRRPECIEQFNNRALFWSSIVRWSERLDVYCLLPVVKWNWSRIREFWTAYLLIFCLHCPCQVHGALVLQPDCRVACSFWKKDLQLRVRDSFAGAAKISRCKSVVFNLGRTPRGDLNHFWRGRELVFYVHSCITFALFEI